MAHYKSIEITDKITTHLRDPKNKILIEFIAKQENKSVSEWVANVLENEVLPSKIGEITKGKGDNNA